MTISWPSRVSRRTMLAPIRPSPMNPICIAIRPPCWRRGRPRALVRGRPARRPGRRPRWTRRIGRSCASMAAKSPAAWASMSWPKVYGQSGIVDVGRVVRGQLEEPADRRAALVELAGRVQEARAVAGRRRPAGPVAQERPDPREGRIPVGRRGDERLEAEVGVRAPPGEVAGELADHVAVAGRQPQRGVAVQRQAVAGRDRLGGGSRPPRRRRARPRRGRRGSAAWPPRRSAGRTGRCPGPPRRSRSRPPSGRTRRRGRSGRRSRSG